MSSPIVDRIRNIPLIVECGRQMPMKVEENSGFPFEREADGDAHFRTQLDDIARRHPEFAEHLGNFRTGANVRRQSSSGGADEPDFPRAFQRPFGSRFDRSGFPFGADDFEPEKYAQKFYQQQPEFPHQQQQQPMLQLHQKPDRSNIQQSNTIDLGQKQEPVNDRNQRSMSAPPSEKQRFTSSINIPVNQLNEEEDMPQTQPQQANAKTTERIIPIHVEDRAEPVLPKKGASTFSQPHHSTYRSGSPQPESIFGRRPEDFTHFVNREPKWHSSFNHPDEFVRQQRFPQQTVPPPFQQQQQSAPKHNAKADIPIPVQVEVPHTKQKAPQQQQERPVSPQPQQQQQPQPMPQQKKPLTSLEQIEEIQKDVNNLASQVNSFGGNHKDKLYLYLDEMLTRNLLKLDNIDTLGQDDIRTARKEAIRNIEKTIGILESKNQSKPLNNRGQNGAEPAQPAAGEAHNKSGENTQPMEVAPENPAGPQIQEKEEKKNETNNPASEEKRAVLVENKPAEPVVENRAVLGQESNLGVAEAVKKFEGNPENKEGETEASKTEENKSDDKSDDKKGKKKGKKKSEKK
ncbi:hypothetical protein NQ317_006935 [Molorchus minor]|uniref:BAG domain-containing protein n=1 Tax=Molorchus minor TaxID=1323400 RepID=A0ABQ9JNP5_9CUCU|nr:hypothetical protein NQ317_006935 [Molorchus minor]